MSEVDDVAKVVEALKEEDAAKKASQPQQPKEKVEEVKEPEVEQKAAEVVPAKAAEPTISEKNQARIDALVERQIEKDRKIAELEKRLNEAQPAAHKEPEVTMESLRALLADESQKQFHPWAFEQMAELKAKEITSGYRAEQSALSTAQKSYDQAKLDFPDMADTTSPLWAKANEIYMSKPALRNDPDGQYMAAVLAAKAMNYEAKAEEVPEEIKEKRVAKEVGKSGLATVSRKVVTTVQDNIATLEKAASGKRPDSPEWNQLLAALEAERLEKKRQK